MNFMAMQINLDKSDKEDCFDWKKECENYYQIEIGNMIYNDIIKSVCFYETNLNDDFIILDRIWLEGFMFFKNRRIDKDGIILINKILKNFSKYKNYISGDFQLIACLKDKILVLRSRYCTYQLFWYKDKNCYYFTNDIRTMLCNKNIAYNINIDACRFFCTHHTQIDDMEIAFNNTFFKEIYRLPENSFSVLSDDLKIYPLHMKKDFLKIPYNRDIKDILKNKISGYKIKGNVGIELSGGIDSACILAALLEAGIEADRIHAFILTFHDEELVNTNDITIATQLVKDFHIHGHVINGDLTLKVWKPEDCGFSNINGPTVSANPYFLKTVSEICVNNNIRYIFTGNGGDELLSGCRYVFDYDFIYDPFKTLRLLFHYGNKKYFFRRIKHFLILPLINFTKVYKQNLWYFENDNIPSFFTKGEKLLDKKLRAMDSRGFKESSWLRYWGKRYIFDFAKSSPVYLQEFFDGCRFVNPMFDDEVFSFSINARPSKLYDVSKTDDYAASKASLRKAFAHSLPPYVIEKSLKTTYNQKNRKTFVNSFKDIYRLFNSDVVYTEKYNIINKEKFLDTLIIFYIICENSDTFLNVMIRYVEGVINLEQWLQMAEQGRKHILELARPMNRQSCSIEVKEL